MDLSSVSVVVGSERLVYVVTECVVTVQGQSSKVIDFGSGDDDKIIKVKFTHLYMTVISATHFLL